MNLIKEIKSAQIGDDVGQKNAAIGLAIEELERSAPLKEIFADDGRAVVFTSRLMTKDEVSVWAMKNRYKQNVVSVMTQQRGGGSSCHILELRTDSALELSNAILLALKELEIK